MAKRMCKPASSRRYSVKKAYKVKTGVSRRGYKFNYVDSVPEGFKKTKGATTAPVGYTWYDNRKSLFGGERISILVKDRD